MPISDDMPFSPSPDGNASPGSFFQAIVFDVLNVQGWTWNAGPGVAMSVSLNLAKS